METRRTSRWIWWGSLVGVSRQQQVQRHASGQRDESLGRAALQWQPVRLGSPGQRGEHYAKGRYEPPQLAIRALFLVWLFRHPLTRLSSTARRPRPTHAGLRNARGVLRRVATQLEVDVPASFVEWSDAVPHFCGATPEWSKPYGAKGNRCWCLVRWTTTPCIPFESTTFQTMLMPRICTSFTGNCKGWKLTSLRTQATPRFSHRGR